MIPYLAYDQCMLRPGQKHQGTFGFIFERPGNMLCDMYVNRNFQKILKKIFQKFSKIISRLLICYPGQLSGNNTLNGLITSIPYRMSRHEVNFFGWGLSVARSQLAALSWRLSPGPFRNFLNFGVLFWRYF